MSPLSAPDPLDGTLLALEEALAPKHTRRTRPEAATGLDYALLQVVAERGPLPLADLFTAMHQVAGPQEVVAGLERLGTTGWLFVGPNGERRIESVLITDLGEAGYRAASEWRAGVRDRVLAGLAPGEREAFLAGLAKVAASLGR